jgi:hypothetical protein
MIDQKCSRSRTPGILINLKYMVRGRMYNLNCAQGMIIMRAQRGQTCIARQNDKPRLGHRARVFGIEPAVWPSKTKGTVQWKSLTGNQFNALKRLCAKALYRVVKEGSNVTNHRDFTCNQGWAKPCIKGQSESRGNRLYKLYEVLWKFSMIRSGVGKI